MSKEEILANQMPNAIEIAEYAKKEAIAFVEWIENNKWVTVSSQELNRRAWIDTLKEDVYIRGSDYHYTNLIKKCGKTTKQLYDLWKIK